MKVGQYTVTHKEEKDRTVWRDRYLVHRVMKKTADVTVLVSKDYEEFTTVGVMGRTSRYPLDLLEQQVENAEYFEFL